MVDKHEGRVYGCMDVHVVVYIYTRMGGFSSAAEKILKDAPYMCTVKVVGAVYS